MASFDRVATVTVSTKRSGGITDGLETAYAEHIASLKCLPLDSAAADRRGGWGMLIPGIEGLAWTEALQTACEGGLDIVEGDLLVVAMSERSSVNLCTNSSFELTTDGWAATGSVIARSTDESVIGDYSLKITPGIGGWGGVEYNLTLVDGEDYTTSAWVLGAAGVPYRMELYDLVTSAPIGGATFFNGTGSWQKVTTTTGTAAGNNAAQFKILKSNSASVTPLYVDDAHIEIAIEYPIRAVAEWTWRGSEYKVLLLQETK